MPEAKTGALPVAYREWAYFGARPDVAELLWLGKPTNVENGQRAPVISGMGVGFSFNLGLGMNASPFKLMARGGQLPLVWSPAAGALLDGLKLESNGVISGAPGNSLAWANISLKRRCATLRAKPHGGSTPLTLRERPNRAVETGRLTSLIHSPENIPAAEIPPVGPPNEATGLQAGHAQFL